MFGVAGFVGGFCRGGTFSGNFAELSLRLGQSGIEFLFYLKLFLFVSLLLFIGFLFVVGLLLIVEFFLFFSLLGGISHELIEGLAVRWHDRGHLWWLYLWFWWCGVFRHSLWLMGGELHFISHLWGRRRIWCRFGFLWRIVLGVGRIILGGGLLLHFVGDR